MFVKCPKCDLNYMDSHDRMCKVCYREIHGTDMPEEMDMCSICNEVPVPPGRDVCAACLKEMGGTLISAPDADAEAEDDDAAAPMDDISEDISGDEELPEPGYQDMDKDLSLEELEEQEEDEADDDDDDEV